MTQSKGSTYFNQVFEALFQALLSEKTRKKIEISIVFIAILSFVVHLLLIGLVELQWLESESFGKLLGNPIAAIYTPFSFILIYEVYLLVYYLPMSISTYIGKQYEVIALIIVRKLFHDLANIKFTPDWFKVTADLQFTYDLVATVLLFFLIFVFYKLNPRKVRTSESDKVLSVDVSQFVKMKKILAVFLVPTLFILAVYSLISWTYQNFFTIQNSPDVLTNINQIFFDKCFGVLIMVDVLLLLISFLKTDQFNKVIRNSGFVISTILIKLSFGAEGLLSTVLIVVAVLFGVIVLAIHNEFEKIIIPKT